MSLYQLNKPHSRYVMYFVCISFAAINVFLQTIPITAASHFSELLHVNVVKIISIYSIYFIVYAALQIPIGFLLGKYGLRKVVIIGLLLSFIGYSLHTFSTNLLFLSLSRILSGIGCSMSYISGIYVAVNFFPSKRLPLLFALMEAIATGGSLLATTPFYWFLQNYGWVAANFVVLGVIGVLFVLAIIFIVDKQDQEEHTNSEGLFKQLISVFKIKSVSWLFMYSFCSWFIIMSFAGYWIKDYMMDMHHYSETKSLNLANIYWVAFLIAGITLGHFFTKLKQCLKVILILSSISIINFAIMAIPIVFDYPLIVAICIIGGITSCGMTFSFAIIPHIVTKELSSIASAVNNLSIVLGGMVGQFVFGWMMLHLNVDTLLFWNLEVFKSAFYYGIILYLGVAILSFIAAFKVYRIERHR